MKFKLAKRRVAGSKVNKRKSNGAHSKIVNDTTHEVVGSAGNAYKFNAEKRSIVLAAMREGKSVAAASKLADVTHVTVFLTRRADKEFGKAFDEARDVGTDMIEDQLHRMATEKGVPGMIAAVFGILNARRPELYRQNFKVEHAGQIAHVKADTIQEAYERAIKGELPVIKQPGTQH